MLIRDPVETLFQSTGVVGLMLVVTGAILMVPRLAGAGKRGTHPVRLIDALVVGLVQGIAVTPGISRSGITIAAGLLMGLRGEEAARFSFLLSVPAILGAIVLEGLGAGAGAPGGYGGGVLLLGLVASFLSGWFALRLVLRLVDSGRLDLFSYYCVGVGLLAVARFWP
jgi:undecaprenyl-diphosphatase